MFLNQKFVLCSADDELGELLSKNGAKVFQASWEDVDLEILENVFFVTKDQNFDDLNLVDEHVRKGKRVISSGFVYEYLEKNMPVPMRDHPLYSSCLENVHVALDASLSEGDREKLEKLIVYMSGTYSNAIRPNETQILVGSAVGSIDYKYALENGIDIVESEWIHECWKEKKYVNTTKFKMKPFCGCLIAVTGLASPTRLEIKKLVENYGGLYTPDLTRSCTHLLSKEPEGLKYHYAIQWGIHCVSPDWLFDSINEQCCKDEKSYLLPVVSRRPTFSPRSRGDLGRMSPKLRSNHVSQIKRQGYSNRARGPMNFVFINSDPKKTRKYLNISNQLKENYQKEYH